MNEQLRDAVGGVIYGGWQSDTDPYELAEEVLEIVALAVQARCTPNSEAYLAGGDYLIEAVADWIEGN